MSKEAKILIGIAAVVLIGGALLAVFANPQPKDAGQSVDEQSLIRDNSHMTGSPDAKVTLVEFGDFQCPACAAAYPNVKQVKEQFIDNPDFNFVFRNFPLDAIHPNARPSANAAEAAGEQGKFWEMHDLLYERQPSWSTLPDPTETFVGYAGDLGLDTDKFRSDLENRIFDDIITADYNDGAAIGVNATPTFFLNGQKLAGFDPASITDQINSLLSSPAVSTDSAMPADGNQNVDEMVVQPDAQSTEPDSNQ